MTAPASDPPIVRTAATTRWRFLAHEVESDFLGATLPAGTGAPPHLRVLRTHDPLPGPGQLLRSFGGTPETGPNIHLWESAEGFQYHVEGLGKFWIHRGGEMVSYQLAAQAADSDVDHMLAGPVLGLAFRERGHAMIHASAVMDRGGAIAFSAPHGFGKSTLAFSFARAGCPLLTDDILGLRACGSGWRAVRSLPRLKLWSASLEALDEEPTDYRPTVTWLEKRRLDLAEMLAPEELPLRALYLLSPRADWVPIEFEDLRGTAAVLSLMGSMYSPESLRGPHEARALLTAASILESVPVRVVRYHRSYDNLPALREAILRDAEAVAR